MCVLTGSAFFLNKQLQTWNTGYSHYRNIHISISCAENDAFCYYSNKSISKVLT